MQVDAGKAEILADRRIHWLVETLTGGITGRKRSWHLDTMAGRDADRQRRWQEDMLAGRYSGG